MIPDSLVPGIVIRAPDKASARESGDEAMSSCHEYGVPFVSKLDNEMRR